MLQLLHIENIAVIEEADITFDEGFNALTGETGAGKSIVIDAMGAVLGQRTSRDLIRTGAAKAFVSAMFSGVPPLPVLEECGLEAEDGELLLQREIYADGKNACRVGGRPVTVAQLRRIGGALLNIHGQHDGQQLLDEEQHGAYLDSFGRVEEELGAYAACYEAMEVTRKKLKSLQMDEAEKERRMDSLTFQIKELEKAQLKPGEEEALLQRRNLLRNSEKFMSAVQGAVWSLTGGDDGGGAVSELREAAGAVSGVKGLDDRFGQLHERLENLYSEAYDVAETLRDLQDSFDFSPQELDELEGRADLLYRLKKKYGPTVEDMLAYLEKCREELDQIAFAADTTARLQKQLEKERGRAMKAARALSEARKAAAKRLEERIQEELRQLDMPKVRFAICFEEKEPDALGIDVVRFLMSANVGEELRPINKVASGGELARIMLALKNVLALCCGVSDGMGLGDNTKALLMTRGMTEMARLGVALGGRKETFAGLSGMGDLIVTCTSMHSRNRRCGILVGQGKSVEEAMKEVGATVEGYYAALSAHQLAEKAGVEMPICECAYRVLYEGHSVQEVVGALMSRNKKREVDESWI